jgi:hypothetical protein
MSSFFDFLKNLQCLLCHHMHGQYLNMLSEHGSIFISLAWICSLNLALNCLPVCPTYFNGKVWQSNRYIPFCLNLSILYLEVSKCFKVLVALKLIFTFVLPKNRVIHLVSLPTYVKVTHFWFACSIGSIFFNVNCILNSINRTVVVMKMRCGFFALETESFNIIQMKFGF